MKHKNFNQIYAYTYYIKRKSDGIQYHGVRYQNIKSLRSPIDDFGKYYFSSGKLKEEFKQNPSNFEWKLKWTFDSIQEALFYETIINERIYKRKNWVNSYGKYVPVKSASIGREKTLMNKYGVNHNSKIPETINKRKETWLKKYGVDNPTKSKYVMEKIKQTCLKKYGVEWSGQSFILKKKIKETWLKKYGVDNPNKSSIIRNKTKRTCLKKYGVKYIFQISKVIDKIHEKRKNMYIRLAKMSDVEFCLYLKSICQLKCIQNQKISQRKKGMNLLNVVV